MATRKVPPRAPQKTYRPVTGLTPAATGWWGLIGAVIGACIGLFIFCSFGGVFLGLLGFNHGIVPFVEACGGSVSKVGFWTSFWTFLAVSSLGAACRGITSKGAA